MGACSQDVPIQRSQKHQPDLRPIPPAADTRSVAQSGLVHQNGKGEEEPAVASETGHQLRELGAERATEPAALATRDPAKDEAEDWVLAEGLLTDADSIKTAGLETTHTWLAEQLVQRERQQKAVRTKRATRNGFWKNDWTRPGCYR